MDVVYHDDKAIDDHPLMGRQNCILSMRISLYLSGFSSFFLPRIVAVKK